jgi:hypothetical protein
MNPQIETSQMSYLWSSRLIGPDAGRLSWRMACVDFWVSVVMRLPEPALLVGGRERLAEPA